MNKNILNLKNFLEFLKSQNQNFKILIFNCDDEFIQKETIEKKHFTIHSIEIFNDILTITTNESG